LQWSWFKYYLALLDIRNCELKNSTTSKYTTATDFDKTQVIQYKIEIDRILLWNFHISIITMEDESICRN